MEIQPVSRGGATEIETFAMANCVMLSSQRPAAVEFASAAAAAEGRMFSCKTCGRKFPSFQALGGHRASHKKVINPSISSDSSDVKSPPKPKIHSCSICGVEFPIGQALGGHMRRHRPILRPSPGSTVTTEIRVENSNGNNGDMKRKNDFVTTEISVENISDCNNIEKKRKNDSVTADIIVENSDGNNNGEKKRKNDSVVLVPILKKLSSCKRICLDLNLCFDLNLNLPSWKDEDDHVIDDDREIEEGEIVEQEEQEESDFLKLELRPPIYNWSVPC